MAPPPEYDKEPKAPDKSATTVTSEEIKVHSLDNDLSTFSDHKSANSASNNDTENNQHVESLDDGQLRALLDEAIQYKCPKDREGKSSLFKELLEEVEHQDEVSEAASRGFIARGGPHANSLQDLMAALKVESATRPVRHQPPPHSQTSVSARAIHGGSLPSGVDTSFMLAEEPTRGGYLATVRCVNPPPLAERRVSASDANTPQEMELLNKSKPVFPMYTARASLEIGSGAVCSGRAVTTTTPSNQVRTCSPPQHSVCRNRFHHRTLTHHQVDRQTPPPGRILETNKPEKLCKQKRLLSALRPKITVETNLETHTGEVPRPLRVEDKVKVVPKCPEDKGENSDIGVENARPRAPDKTNTQSVPQLRHGKQTENTAKHLDKFDNTVENWYKALDPKFSDSSNKDIKVHNITTSNRRTPVPNSKKPGIMPRNQRSEKGTIKSERTANTIDRSCKVLQPKCADGGMKIKENKNSDIPQRKCGAEHKNIVNDSSLRRNEKIIDVDKKPQIFSETVNTSSLKILPPKCAKSVKKDKTVSENSDVRPLGFGDTSAGNILRSLRVETEDIAKGSEPFVNTVDSCPNALQPKFQDSNGDIKICDKSAGNHNKRAPEMVNIGVAPRLSRNDDVPEDTKKNSEIFTNAIDNWYKGLTHYTNPLNANKNTNTSFNQIETDNKIQELLDINKIYTDINPNIQINDIVMGNDIFNPFAPKIESDLCVDITQRECSNNNDIQHSINVTSENRNLPISLTDDYDIRNYRKKVGRIERATLSSINPRNVKSMTIGKPEQLIQNSSIITNKTTKKEPKIKVKLETVLKTEQASSSSNNIRNVKCITIQTDQANKPNFSSAISNKNKNAEEELTQTNIPNLSDKEKSSKIQIEENQVELGLADIALLSEMQSEIKNKKTLNKNKKLEQSDHEMKEENNNENLFEMKDMSKSENIYSDNIEMKCVSKAPEMRENVDSFITFVANQHNLFRSLETIDSIPTEDVISTVSQKDEMHYSTKKAEQTKENIHSIVADSTTKSSNSEEVKIESIMTNTDDSPKPKKRPSFVCKTETNQAVTRISGIENRKVRDHYDLAELSNNAYVFLTFPKHPATPLGHSTVKLQELENTKVTAHVPGEKALVKKKKDEQLAVGSSKGKKKEISRNSLRTLLLETLLKRDGVDRGLARPAGAAIEVDSTIPFSCITTPEVVASCNTTSSTAQSAVAVDPKPRSVISSTFNGLPLSRPNYGATASADHEYKKSLDENGNAVQGIGSPVSGSSQHKKPRRKKSSKNETVIKSHQIDGYQGNKDLNEVLRFIESNADAGRGGKLRGKHKDDDDKGKKRSSERRKAQEKGKRASSLEELSRTKLEDLTDAPEPAPAKPERRSWGDDARDYFREPEPAPAPDHDFQTVTKRRKRRERNERDERGERDPRRARAPEPRARRESAPPSDRSNDSNDDMDSVHSLPAPPRAPLAAPHASYADIARTRHNIPDLIESCNFYAEGEAGGDARRPEPAPGPADADGYPALEPRAAPQRRKPAAAPAPRRDRKERPPAAPPDSVAPDVVSDRRPPVILLDSAAQARDMDGVTFGFDINEQLLDGGARRPRCDLVRDAAEAEAGAEAGTETGAVSVSAGCRPLRYVPPNPPPDTHHLHQIIDYVGAAWEDVIRCGAGKVRYFSE